MGREGSVSDMYCLPKGETIQEAERASVFGRLWECILLHSKKKQLAWMLEHYQWADGDHRYFLLIVDLFSHYIEAVALKDQTSRSIVNAFLEGWVYHGHGVPKVVITDQGKNVDGLAVHELCHYLEIENTTPHPTTRSQTEWQKDMDSRGLCVAYLLISTNHIRLFCVCSMFQGLV